MVNKNTKAFVRMTPKRPDKNWSRVTADFKRAIKDGSRRLAEESLKRVRENTPVRSGRVRDQWSVTVNNSANTSFTINLNNPSQVVDFLNRGTNPSPGRYVPQLGRRIRTGTHPGIQATKFLDRTEDEVAQATEIAMKDVARFVTKSTRRNMRGRRV